MTLTTETLLHELLKRNAPTAHSIRGFLFDLLGDDPLHADLPDPAVSSSVYAAEAAIQLLRHGAVDEGFLGRLVRALPHEASAVNDIRRSLGLPLSVEEFLSFDLLTDNWVYQDIAELFADGPRDHELRHIGVHERLTWTHTCWTGVALESLLTVLAAIVLRDRFLVEERYIAAWTRDDSPVLGLHAGGMLCPIPEPDGLASLRTQYYREFFQAPALHAWHRDNSKALREHRPVHEYESAVLWGSIGYLTRSALLDVPYVGHPVRRNFLAQTPLVHQDSAALTRTLDTIDVVRRQHIAAMEDESNRLIRYILPPLIVDIVHAASAREDLVEVALQYREEFRDLRRWLALFQKALRARDRGTVAECEHALATLRGAGTGPNAHGSFRHEVASRTIHSLTGLHRPAALLCQRLTRTRSGEATLDKLLDLFEVSKSALELPVLTHLRNNFLTPA